MNLPHSLKHFIAFLKEVSEIGQKSVVSRKGLIVYADDQFINIKQMDMQMKDIGLQGRLKLFSNGQDVIDFFEHHLSELSRDDTTEQVRQPVSLVLLDINMPLLNGIETLMKVKQTFDTFNQSATT